jgi:uncharacterized protein YchJ
MARDWLGERFDKKKKDKTLEDLALKGKTKDEIEAEKKLIKETKKVDPLEAKPEPGRNDPCPCGSGKKYKKCCGAK